MKLTYNWQAVTAIALLAFALTQLNIIGSAVDAHYFPNAKENLIAAALAKEGLIAVALVALSAILSMSAGNKSVLPFAFGLFAHLGALKLLGMLSIAEGSASFSYFADARAPAGFSPGGWSRFCPATVRAGRAKAGLAGSESPPCSGFGY